MKLENMELEEKAGVTYLTFPAFSALGFVRHAFSTRKGGVSTGEFDSMNLSFGRGDSDESVRENYLLFCKAAGFSADTLVASAQDHNTVVRRVTEDERGLGIWKPRDWDSVDGLVTNTPNVTLVTSYADCTPLFFADPIHHAIGLAHAGWRGTAAYMGKIMVEAMTREFGTRPEKLIAAIGPAIGPCCYEVDEPCARHFLSMDEQGPQSFVFPKENGKYWVDLWESNRKVLLSAGVLEQNITVARICTKCHSDLLWSHRATGGRRGGLCAFLQIDSEVEMKTERVFL